MNLNLLLAGVRFINNHRVFEKGEELQFFPGITLLVGDQGCGKSTLIKEIAPEFKMGSKNIELLFGKDLPEGKKLSFLRFDSENDNPRTKGYFDWDDKLFGGVFQVQAKWMSHGQCGSTVLIRLLSKAIMDIKDKQLDPSIICLDEPESGLSIRSQYKLAYFLRAVASWGHQVIVATHSLPLITEIGKVYSLEHKTHMTADEFVNTQKDYKHEYKPPVVDKPKAKKKSTIKKATKRAVTPVGLKKVE